MDRWKTRLEEREQVRERRDQRETWEGEEIDRGIRSWFTGGAHVWPIAGERATEG